MLKKNLPDIEDGMTPNTCSQATWEELLKLLWVEKYEDKDSTIIIFSLDDLFGYVSKTKKNKSFGEKIEEAEKILLELRKMEIQTNPKYIFKIWKDISPSFVKIHAEIKWFLWWDQICSDLYAAKRQIFVDKNLIIDLLKLYKKWKEREFKHRLEMDGYLASFERLEMILTPYKKLLANQEYIDLLCFIKTIIWCK